MYTIAASIFRPLGGPETNRVEHHDDDQQTHATIRGLLLDLLSTGERIGSIEFA